MTGRAGQAPPRVQSAIHWATPGQAQPYIQPVRVVRSTLHQAARSSPPCPSSVVGRTRAADGGDIPDCKPGEDGHAEMPAPSHASILCGTETSFCPPLHTSICIPNQSSVFSRPASKVPTIGNCGASNCVASTRLHTLLHVKFSFISISSAHPHNRCGIFVP